MEDSSTARQRAEEEIRRHVQEIEERRKRGEERARQRQRHLWYRVKAFIYRTLKKIFAL
jgi:hypothetical protein